jgi:Co/Zn/Cd efflux system component
LFVQLFCENIFKNYNIGSQIWYVTGILLFLSIRRLVTNDFEVESNPMMVVAGCAVVFNVVLGLLLHGAGHGHSHGGSPAVKLEVGADDEHDHDDRCELFKKLVLLT